MPNSILEVNKEKIRSLISGLKKAKRVLTGRKLANKIGAVASKIVRSRILNRSGMPYKSKWYKNRLKLLGIQTRAVEEHGLGMALRSDLKNKPPVSHKTIVNGSAGYIVRIHWFDGPIGKDGVVLKGENLAQIRESRKATMYLDGSDIRKIDDAAEKYTARYIRFMEFQLNNGNSTGAEKQFDV